MICTICHQPIEEAKIETSDGPQHFRCFCDRQPQPEDLGYFPPYDDLGNRRTIKNAVDPGWSAI